MMPVAYVARPKRLLLPSSPSITSVSPASAALPSSSDSLKPTMPMAMSVIPTRTPPHRERTGTRCCTCSLNMTKTSPMRSCPVLCPPPHSAPRAALAPRDRPIVRGARAARWSGPASVWRHPAASPPQALRAVAIMPSVFAAPAAMLRVAKPGLLARGRDVARRRPTRTQSKSLATGSARLRSPRPSAPAPAPAPARALALALATGPERVGRGLPFRSPSTRRHEAEPIRLHVAVDSSDALGRPNSSLRALEEVAARTGAPRASDEQA
mmetsp:Transcript_39133/g.124567  ORF Transcript_39133/g.124567 Transcript_39133/m.124567 type:complete len:268 (+) Transcript_39133:690-1493(+)